MRTIQELKATARLVSIYDQRTEGRMRIPVWKYLANGKRVATWIKSHTCTRRCLILTRQFGRVFASCKRYSYRGRE